MFLGLAMRLHLLEHLLLKWKSVHEYSSGTQIALISLNLLLICLLHLFEFLLVHFLEII